MKILERLALILFSIIMIVIAVTICLVIGNIVELKSIFNFIEELIDGDLSRKIILTVSIISIILAIKSLFFSSKNKKKQEIKTGILLENKDGRLLISRETVENLVNSVVKSFDDAVDVQTKINLDSNNDITVYASLLVKEDSIIKELSSNIQSKIKDTIKKSTGLEINQVNINIKDIENNKKNVNNKNNTNNGNLVKLKLQDVKVNQNQANENKINDQKNESSNFDDMAKRNQNITNENEKIDTKQDNENLDSVVK